MAKRLFCTTALLICVMLSQQNVSASEQDERSMLDFICSFPTLFTTLDENEVFSNDLQDYNNMRFADGIDFYDLDQDKIPEAIVMMRYNNGIECDIYKYSDEKYKKVGTLYKYGHPEFYTDSAGRIVAFSDTNRGEYSAAYITLQGGKMTETPIDFGKDGSPGTGVQLKFVDDSGNVLLTGFQVKDVYVTSSNYGKGVEIALTIEFTEEGGQSFKKATEDNIGKQIYIIFNDSVISAPFVQNKITSNKAVIQGSFNRKDASELANLMRHAIHNVDYDYIKSVFKNPTIYDKSLIPVPPMADDEMFEKARNIVEKQIADNKENGTAMLLLDGRVVNTSAPPVIINGCVFVPLRDLGTLLGYETRWEPETKEIEIDNGKTSIQLWIDSNVAIVNGQKSYLDDSPRLANGVAMVPLRFIAESMSCRTVWEKENRIVFLYD